MRYSADSLTAFLADELEMSQNVPTTAPEIFAKYVRNPKHLIWKLGTVCRTCVCVCVSMCLCLCGVYVSVSVCVCVSVCIFWGRGEGGWVTNGSGTSPS